MQLWTPNGNKWQTEIDVMIAELRYHNQQLEESLGGIVMSISLLDREIADLQHALSFLKKSNVAVSVIEFHKMKKDLHFVKQIRQEKGEKIPVLKKRMSENDKEIYRLDKERTLVRTQVIPIKDRR